jgi:hypothetical protein
MQQNKLYKHCPYLQLQSVLVEDFLNYPFKGGAGADP